jgi:hypothetical protein
MAGSRGRRVIVICAAALAVGGTLLALVEFTSAGEDGRSARAAESTECSGAAELDFACYEQRYIKLTRSSGPKVALRDLARQRNRRGFVRSACHQLTHRIGRIAGRAEGIDAVRKGDPVCSAGYYHGISEAIMDRIGAENILERADTVCAKLRRRERYSPDHYNCAHGMGHGFMGLFASDVFDSLAGCDALEDRWEQENCYGGVFMENLSALAHPSRPPDVRPRQPLYPCTVVARRYKSQCYNQQTTYAVYVNDSDFGKVFRLCARTEKDYRAACYRGLGGNAAIQSSKLIRGQAAKTDTLRGLCGLGSDSRARANCVVGAVRIMLRDVADGEPRVAAFCKSYSQAAARDMHALCLKARDDAYRELPLRQKQNTYYCDLRDRNASLATRLEER